MVILWISWHLHIISNTFAEACIRVYNALANIAVHRLLYRVPPETATGMIVVMERLKPIK